MTQEEGEKAPPPEIIQMVNSGDVASIKNLLLKGEAKVDEEDSSGMTALHHAAYKGSVDVCKLLISHEADVNSDSHDHRYSPLHFAALSDSVDCVQQLLTAGAKSYHTNSLGRTATQMAAFVGNHAVVALINNYVPMSDVLQHTKPSGLEKESKIPPSVAQPLYELIMQVNLHPVRVALLLESSKELQNNITEVWKVLDYMCDKESKRPENVNEVICMKFHYMAFVLKTLEKEMKKLDPSAQEQDSGKETSMFESIIRKWLRGRQADGFEEHLEYFVRDAVKSFPCVEMPLFMQLVRNMTGGKLGETSALCVLSGCINGQRAFQDDKACSTCGQEGKGLRKCSKCKMAQYCDRGCQKLHWPIHKKICDKLLVEFKKQEKQLEDERRREEEEKQKENEQAEMKRVDEEKQKENEQAEMKRVDEEKQEKENEEGGKKRDKEESNTDVREGKEKE